LYLQVGNHIDISNGKWTALDAGIGGGIDSYFEYLVKGGIMFEIPELLQMLLQMFHGELFNMNTTRLVFRNFAQ